MGAWAAWHSSLVVCVWLFDLTSVMMKSLLMTTMGVMVCMMMVEVGGMGEGEAPGPPRPVPRPTMPVSWTARFVGEFFWGPCFHQGWMYYDGEAKLLRTDWMFLSGYAKNSACQKSIPVDLKSDVNDGNAHVIRNYAVQNATQGTYVCRNIPLPGWWEPDYLANATYVGRQTITPFYPPETPRETDVFESTGLFIAGTVLTYIDPDSSEFVRMDVLQDANVERYSVWFLDKGGLVSTALDPSVFDPFPGMPCKDLDVVDHLDHTHV